MSKKMCSNELEDIHIISSVTPITTPNVNRWFRNKNSKAHDMVKKCLPQFDKFFQTIIEYIGNEESLENLKQHLQQKLQNGSASLSKVSSFKTRYFGYMDSHCESNDFVWGIEYNNHFCIFIDTIWEISNFQCAQCSNYFKNNFKNIDKIIAICGYKVTNHITKTFQSLKNICFNDIPDFEIDYRCQCVTTPSNIIQKLYCAHSHCSMTTADDLLLRQHIKNWPQRKYLSNSRHRNPLPQIYNPQTDVNIQYCGWYRYCKSHQTCKCQCENGPDIIPYCGVLQDGIFKLYSIYQGFIPRLFSTVKISELL